ncbi:MAG: DNA translocase FtsK [candidate division WOR-3 bacterium]
MATKRRTNKNADPRTTRFILALVLALLDIFLLASISSYLLGFDSPRTNYGGIVGAWLARLCCLVLGRSAVVVPLLLGGAWVIAFLGRPIWRRFWGFIAITAGVLLAAGLLDYHAGAIRTETNFVGWAGAAAAGFLSRWLGVTAYLLAVLMVYWGLVISFRPPRRQDIVQTGFIALVGLFFMLFAGYFAGNLYLNGPLGARGRFALAGEWGRWLIGVLRTLLGPVGSLIVLVAAAASVVALMATLGLPELSWLRLVVRAAFSLRRRPAGQQPESEKELSAPTPASEQEPVTAPARTEPIPAESKETTRPKRTRPLLPPAPKFDLTGFQSEFLAQLDQPGEKDRIYKDRRESEAEAEVLMDKLRQFGIDGRIVDILSGPMVTRFELEPAPGVKITSIASRADDISLALAAERVRILAPIPGKNAVGIEIPNKERRTVFLREVLTSEPFREERSPLGFALGTTITGDPTCADLRAMPHVLIAGTTGSGKSVCINSIIASIIYRSSARDVRFLTIDPKQLELPVYNPIPHLLGPTTIDPDRAVKGLARIVDIMEARYGEFANIGVRDIIGYNERARQDGFAPKPYIVVIIDELADLMLRAPNEIEERITRLAQMSRAVGIHLVLATQRPSVDVITGLIKANFPCRIAFQVASKTDSRTILDMNGAESLLGRGDMLFLPPGKGEPVRLHGCFVSDRAAKRIVDLWARTYLTELLSDIVEQPEEKARLMVERDVVDVLYDKERSGIKRKLEDLRTILPEEAVDKLMSRRYYEPLPEESPEAIAERQGQDPGDRELDEKFVEAALVVVRHREASVSMLQRRLDIGWARAGRIIDQLEQAGIVGPYVGSKSRKVLVDSETSLQKLLSEMRGEQ